jgi:hypothetical protein
MFKAKPTPPADAPAAEKAATNGKGGA